MIESQHTAAGRGFAAIAIAAALLARPAAAGETVCPGVADNSICSHASGQTENAGKSKRIKIKGFENVLIFKFDLSGIPADAVVEKAVVSLKLESPEYRIRQIGYSTLPTDWKEGDNESGKANSCCQWPGTGQPWGAPGSRFEDAIFGNAGNVSGRVLAREAGGRYEIDLPGRVVDAMRKDQPGGLALMDESGKWSGKLANIYVMSRESGQGPSLKVTWSERRGDKQAPSTPAIAAAPDVLEDGQMVVEIVCGGGQGTAGEALGFDMAVLEGQPVTAGNWSRAKPLPRYRIPRPRPAGEKLRLWIAGLEPGKPFAVGIVAYDERGIRSGVASTPVIAAAGPSSPARLPMSAATRGKGGPVKAGEALQLWAVDELTSVDPTSGRTQETGGYVERDARAGNHVWAGAAREVVLPAVRGEIVAFRMVVENTSGQPVKGVSFKPSDLKSAGGGAIPAERCVLLRRDWYLKVKNAWYVNAVPELNGKEGGKLDVPARDQNIPTRCIAWRTASGWATTC